jgi:protein-tyrosine phosphatase
MTKKNRILFLCTGNYYRSRYAEDLFNHRARLAGLKWRAFSRGLAEQTSPDNVGPMSRFALEALRAKAIAGEGSHRLPQPCMAADFESAELIIALKEAEHRPMLEQRFPRIVGKVSYWHVDDIDFAAPEEALALIERHVLELIAELQRQVKSSPPLAR